MRTAKNKINKLQVLKEIAKGKRTVTSLMPPRSFIVTAKDGLYDVNGPNNQHLFLGLEPDASGHVKMNEEQYQAFKESLRKEDIIFEIVMHDFSAKSKSEPVKELPAPPKQLPAPQKLLPYSVDDIKDHYSPANTPDKQTPGKKTKAKNKPVMMIEQPVIQMKQSGLLSEYGTTWKASFGN